MYHSGLTLSVSDSGTHSMYSVLHKRRSGWGKAEGIHILCVCLVASLERTWQYPRWCWRPLRASIFRHMTARVAWRCYMQKWSEMAANEIRGTGPFGGSPPGQLSARTMAKASVLGSEASRLRTKRCYRTGCQPNATVPQALPKQTGTSRVR